MLLAAFAVAGCSKPEPPRNYVNAENKFRMNRPDGWEELKDWNDLTASDKDGNAVDVWEVGLAKSVDVAFISPKRLLSLPSPDGTPDEHGDTSLPPLPRAVIAVKTCSAPATGGAMALFEQDKAEIITKLTGEAQGKFEILKSGDFTTSNGKAYYVYCSWTRNHSERLGLLVFSTSARRAGMVLCGCAKEDYPVFEEIFKNACQSFYLDLEE
jgi:hypothetical protein